MNGYDYAFHQMYQNDAGSSGPPSPVLPQAPPCPPMVDARPSHFPPKVAHVGYNNNVDHYGPPNMSNYQVRSPEQHKPPVNLYQINRVDKILPFEPPVINLPRIFEYVDVNCSPDILRCTLNNVPSTQDLLKKCRLPFGIVLHPFKDMKQLNVLQSSSIVRCRSCRTYINPFVSFPDQRTWKCNICLRRNDLPDEFHYDPATQTYGEANRRPEIKNASVEFIAPSEYMVRAPQVPVYFYVLDVSQNAADTGYLDSFCSRLVASVNVLPGDVKSYIGFLCVDSNLHFFKLQEGRMAKELIVSDLDETFSPLYDGLLIEIGQNKNAIIEFLQHLPQLYRTSRDPNCALGAALLATNSLLTNIGGRVTVMQTILPNIGPGTLNSREDPNLRASKDVTNLDAATDFYRNLALNCSAQQIAVDLFILSSKYADLATVSEISKFSGGCIYFYQNFHSLRNQYELRRYEEDLYRYFGRKIGFEAVLRVRCTRGLSLHSFFGNFFVRSTDLLNLPNVNPDSACGMLIQMEENFAEFSTACFQAALLYTSSKGERRIRVHTLCLPIKSQLGDIFVGADAQAITSVLSKMAADRCVVGSLSDAREALVNACVDSLAAYSKAQSAPLSGGGCLVAPDSLRNLPLYILGLLKHTAFTYGTSIKLDSRIFAMCCCRTLPLNFLMLQIYPSLYPLHLIDATNCEAPPLLPLSFERIDRHGVYLMDTGDWLLIYVGQSVAESLCCSVFGSPQFNAISEDLDFLPELNNPLSTAIRKFICGLTDRRPISSPLKIIREDGPDRDFFVKRLVDDRCETTFGYVEFLQHIQKELNPR